MMKKKMNRMISNSNLIHDTLPYLSHTAPTLQASSQALKQHSPGMDHAATSLAPLDFYTAQAAL